MRLLLDTHTFIWWDAASKQLSSSAKDAIVHLENDVFLSIVTLWEIQIKSQLGKIIMLESLADKVERQIAQNRIQLLSITPEHIYQLVTIGDHHRDPFDRLLIAQAISEQMILVTSDAIISKYSVDVLW